MGTKRGRVRIGTACGTPPLLLLLLLLLLLATTCREAAGPHPPPAPARYVRFVEGLVAPSGLVRSRPGEDFSTGWKNALAVMVFLHEGNVPAARAVLDVFERYRAAQGAAFRGLPQPWSPDAGVPLPQAATPDADYYWVGDGAGVLLAVRYYGASTGDAP
jgi:hypothetical protein